MAGNPRGKQKHDAKAEVGLAEHENLEEWRQDDGGMQQQLVAAGGMHGQMDDWRQKGEGINPYVGTDRKKCRHAEGMCEGEEEETPAAEVAAEDAASSEAGLDYLVEDVASSEESEVEAQNDRITRLRHRMELMLGDVNRSLKGKRDAEKIEAELEQCRSDMLEEKGQAG